jgi:hypothetical protein
MPSLWKHGLGALEAPRLLRAPHSRAQQLARFPVRPLRPPLLRANGWARSPRRDAAAGERGAVLEIEAVTQNHFGDQMIGAAGEADSEPEIDFPLRREV